MQEQRDERCFQSRMSEVDRWRGGHREEAKSRWWGYIGEKEDGEWFVRCLKQEGAGHSDPGPYPALPRFSTRPALVLAPNKILITETKALPLEISKSSLCGFWIM